MRTVLWLEDLNAEGLTPREKEELVQINKDLNEIANKVRAMGWKIKRENL